MSDRDDRRTIASPTAIVARVASDDERRRWCILRTSGSRTLPLAQSLRAAGIDAWTPVEVKKKSRRRQRPIEREYPIAPTFVFAPATDIVALAHAAVDPLSDHPPFHLFRHADRVPVINEVELDGYRVAEADAAVRLAAVREADNREARRVERAAQQRTAHARRKMLKRLTRDLKPGTAVEVLEMPAMAGMTGEIVKGNGTSALVSFGGSLVMTIEAWQLVPNGVAP